MKPGRLTERIFDKNPKTQIRWYTEVKNKINEIKFKKDHILDKDSFREKINEFGGFQGKKEATNKNYLDGRK